MVTGARLRQLLCHILRRRDTAHGMTAIASPCIALDFRDRLVPPHATPTDGAMKTERPHPRAQMKPNNYPRSPNMSDDETTVCMCARPLAAGAGICMHA